MILPEDDGIVNTKRPPREFKVKFRWANDINMAPLKEYLTGRTQINNNILTAIMAIDIIIRTTPLVALRPLVVHSTLPATLSLSEVVLKFGLVSYSRHVLHRDAC